MAFIEKNKIKTDDLYKIEYFSDKPLYLDNIIKLIEKYQTKEAELYECTCTTTDEKGKYLEMKYSDIDSIKQMRDLPNRNMQISAIYVDPETKEYKYDISSNLIRKTFEYKIDSNLKDKIKKEIELSQMQEENELPSNDLYQNRR